MLPYISPIVHDLILFCRGYPSDWHCESCGTAYTPDVAVCILYVRYHRTELYKHVFISGLRVTSCPLPDSQAGIASRNELQADQPRDFSSFSTGDCNHIVTESIRGLPYSSVKPHEMYPSPTMILDKLSKHVDSLLRLGHSGVGLKEVIVEGDVGLCMDLGMKGLIVRTERKMAMRFARVRTSH